MADPLDTISEVLRDAFTAATGLAGSEIDPVVRPSDRADAQSNGALPLAKRIGRNPRELAQAVVDSGVLDAACSVVEVAGPGFINITFRDELLARELAACAADEHLGVVTADVERHYVVDYSAPNVAKEMHVGHVRSTFIGDSLVRLLTFVGHRVTRENHIGDWGRPFGMHIEHLLDIGEAEAAHELSVGELDGFYKQASAKFVADPEFQERARQRVVELQLGDPESMRLWRLIVDESTRYFNSVYRRLQVLLSDEDVMGESAYNVELPGIVERLRNAGLLEHSEGAEVVFVPGYTNRDGEPLPLIVRNSVGGFNYGTTDLATVVDRVERLHADVVLYVVGAPQAQHLEMVFAVARLAGWLPAHVEVAHVEFGNVLGPDRKMFRSRSGESVKLSDLIDEAIQRATAAVRSKNPEMDPAEQEDVGRMIGIGALKYADLSTDRVKDYVFDWDRMLAFEGNTGPYLQYAHARICSIFRRAGIDRQAVTRSVVVMGEAEERALALQLLHFDAAVHDTLARCSPHRLCTYLFDVAQAFTAFYEACPVVKAADEDARRSRLALCDLTARVLERGLGLLGIDAPERM